MRKTGLGLIVLSLIAFGPIASAKDGNRRPGSSCAAFPCAVATVTLTSQNQTIPLTPIYTPPVAGLFRVTAYLSTPGGQKNDGQWDIRLAYTADIGEQLTPPYVCLPGRSAVALLWFVGEAGQPISYTVAPYAAQPSDSFSVYITVEQLQ